MSGETTASQGPPAASALDQAAAPTSPAERQLRLAIAWQLRGNVQAAIAGYRRALHLDPHLVDAYLRLGGLLLRQGLTHEGLDCYEQALARGADDARIVFRHQYLSRLLDGSRAEARPPRDAPAVPAAATVSWPGGGLDLRDQKTFASHRSGWAYAMRALQPLHDDRGVQFDGFVENNFAWRHWQDGVRPQYVLDRLRWDGSFDTLATSEEHGITPYTRPWVGVLHNPPGMPTWFHEQESPQTIFAKDIWKRSLDWCLGLFTLSEYHARWVREQTGKPVSALVPPTEVPDTTFDFERFRRNPRKQVVQVGWWLRRLNAIYELPLAEGNALGYQKTRLVPRFFSDADRYLKELIEKERQVHGLAIDSRWLANTDDVQHVSDSAYDDLLSENLVFLSLYDSSANNVVVECIARGTPLLVNPLPAIVEYLGEDYPMYYETFNEAAAKALDLSLVYATHRYLLTCATRDKLSSEHFRQSLLASDVYQLSQS